MEISLSEVEDLISTSEILLSEALQSSSPPALQELINSTFTMLTDGRPFSPIASKRFFDYVIPRLNGIWASYCSNIIASIPIPAATSSTSSIQPQRSQTTPQTSRGGGGDIMMMTDDNDANVNDRNRRAPNDNQIRPNPPRGRSSTPEELNQQRQSSPPQSNSPQQHNSPTRQNQQPLQQQSRNGANAAGGGGSSSNSNNPPLNDNNSNNIQNRNDIANGGGGGDIAMGSSSNSNASEMPAPVPDMPVMPWIMGEGRTPWMSVTDPVIADRIGMPSRSVRRVFMSGNGDCFFESIASVCLSSPRLFGSFMSAIGGATSLTPRSIRQIVWERLSMGDPQLETIYSHFRALVAAGDEITQSRYGFMKNVATVEQFIDKVLDSDFWVEEWMIKYVHQRLNLYTIIATVEDNRVIGLSQMRHADMEIFRSDRRPVYCILRLSYNHYELVAVRGRVVFTREELPEGILRNLRVYDF